MKYWNIYITCVKRNCASSENEKDLAYWRDNLFAGAIIYLLPFCLITLLPSLTWIFITHMYMIAVIDLLAITGIVVVAFVPGIRQPVRKLIFIACVYLFSCALLYYTGLPGPGLLYLLAACILTILIFPIKYAYWPAWFNVFICILFAAGIYLDIISGPANIGHPVGEWLVVCTNFLFVCFFLAALIPRLFNGLQETIDKEKLLQKELNNQHQTLKEALLMLHEKNNELEQFAYVASHDLKEPLRMVTSFMGLLKRRYGIYLEEKALEYIGFAIDGGKRMQLMIDGLLELSRTGRRNSTKDLVDLGDIIIEVKQIIYKLARESGSQIIIKNAFPVLPVYRYDISRLFQNLFTNAIKFRKKETGLVIRLDVKEHENDWLFSVEDNGIGIEEGKCENIFEIFTRLHSRETYEGTGIGLAICKKVVEHHGGKIWAESIEGKGSTIYFTLLKQN